MESLAVTCTARTGKIGTAPQVYADDQTGRPEWVTVGTGLFGPKETFIPLADATVSGDQLTVPYAKAFVKDAANVDEDGHLSPDQERELYAYYSRTDYDADRGPRRLRRHHQTGSWRRQPVERGRRVGDPG